MDKKQIACLSIIYIAYYIFFIDCLIVFGCDIKWKSIGPGGGGYITSIKFDLQNENTIYVGCDVGGFYVSYDKGENWVMRNKGLNDFYVQSICILQGMENALIVGTKGGIFKSTNSGELWKWKRIGFPKPSKSIYSAPISCIASDPKNPLVIYAGIGDMRFERYGRSEIFKSSDGGESWYLCASEKDLGKDAIISDIVIDKDGRYILVITNKGIYRSADNGDTWINVNEGLPHRYCLKGDISESNSNICYITLKTIAYGKMKFNGGIYKSTDGGFTWTDVSEVLPRIVRKKRSDSLHLSSQYQEVIIHPKDPNTIYVGAIGWPMNGIFKSSDGGKIWKRILFRGGNNVNYGWLSSFSTSITALDISFINPVNVVCGTSAHIFLSDNQGITWQNRYSQIINNNEFKTNGLETACAIKGYFDQFDSNRIYLCYADIKMVISDTFGEKFINPVFPTNHNDAYVICFDPANKHKMWIGVGQNEKGCIYRSTDIGLNWKLAGSPETGLPSGIIDHILVDPSGSDANRILYLANRNYGIYKSNNDGLEWEAINNGLPEIAAKFPIDIIMNPNNPNNLRCLLGSTPEEGSGIYETFNGGKKWVRISKKNAPFQMAMSLVADPQNWDVLYVCQFRTYINKEYPGGLFRSIDGGRNWSHIYSDFKNAECVSVSPINSDIIYLGTNEHPYHDSSKSPGILKSEDWGQTWHPINCGISNTKIKSISINPKDPSLLLIGTAGNGFFIGRDIKIEIK